MVMVLAKALVATWAHGSNGSLCIEGMQRWFWLTLCWHVALVTMYEGYAEMVPADTLLT